MNPAPLISHQRVGAGLPLQDAHHLAANPAWAISCRLPAIDAAAQFAIEGSGA
jgi:hypothetical protein